MNSITHEGGYYNKDFFPQEKPVLFSNEEISKFNSVENTEYIYIVYSAFKQLIKWIDYLKVNGIYDNTRIIIVSDHGGYYHSSRSDSGMEGYNPVLMFKDFNNRGKLNISNDFMTHSDTRYLASAGLNLINFENFDIKNEKEREITVFTTISSQPLRHGPYQFNFAQKRKLAGREILKEESWNSWQKY